MNALTTRQKHPGIAPTGSSTGLARTLALWCCAVLLWLCAIPAGSTREIHEIPFPNELTAMRVEYIKSLEPLEDELLAGKAKLKKEYYQALDDLGREFVEQKDQAGAVAVKIEQRRLKGTSGFYPNADVEGGRELRRLRDKYEVNLENLDAEAREKFVELAEKYIAKLKIWEDLYTKRRNRTNAVAVRAEITRIRNYMRGLDAEGNPSRNAQADEAAQAGAAQPVSRQISHGGSPDRDHEPGSPLTEAGTQPAQPDPAPQHPAPPEDGLVLKEEWQISDGLNGKIIKGELAELLTPFGRPANNIGPHPSLVVYGSLNYLAPLSVVRARLGLEGVQAQSGVLSTPGLPWESIKYHRFDTRVQDLNDQEQYQRVTVLTDLDDQFLGLVFHRPNPGFSLQYRPMLPDYQTWDYPFGRLKENPAYGIWHKVHYQNSTGQYVEWAEGDVANRYTHTIRIDTLYFADTLAVRNMVRWYIPRPFVDVILKASTS
jgi:hypothetical protein